MSKKVNDRKIYIACDFVTEINNLFHHFSSQLSDGYWENSRGDYGSYEDGYYEDIWNCFDFDTKQDGFHRNERLFEITLKSKPTWDDAKEDCKKMHTWTDQQIVDYLKEALIDSIEGASDAFWCYSDSELEALTKAMNSWKIIPPKPPKMTHEELVKIVGHDFEYVE